jgi:hypothetical protein
MLLLSRACALFVGCLLVHVSAAGEARILAFETLPSQAMPSRGWSPAERLAFSAYGKAFELELDHNARLLDAMDAPIRASAIGTDNLFLDGSVVGIEGSWARLSRIDGRWTGGFYDGRELYLMDAAEQVTYLLPRPAPPGSTVLYRMGDLVMPGFHGDVAHPVGSRRRGAGQAAFGTFVDHLRAAGGPTGSVTRELGITVVTDTEYTAVHGADANAVTASRINLVDGIYSAQLGIRITATHVRNLTDNGSLGNGPDGIGLVSLFQAYMTTGAGSSIPKGGVNHLFSGRNFDFGVMGVALTIGGLCDPELGYAINDVSVANSVGVIVIAHEMGHNFGAPHDGQVGSACQAQFGNWLMAVSPFKNTTTFSPCSLQQIAGPINSATCFLQTSELLFRNSFEF